MPISYPVSKRRTWWRTEVDAARIAAEAERRDLRAERRDLRAAERPQGRESSSGLMMTRDHKFREGFGRST
jgi:hypothetical protein